MHIQGMIHSQAAMETTETAAVSTGDRSDTAAARESDTVTISEEGRRKAAALGEGSSEAGGEKGARSSSDAGGSENISRDLMSGLESKDEVVEDLQDTESDIRSAEQELEAAKNSPALSDAEREKQMKTLEHKLRQLKDDADEMKSKLSADE